jgi:hypothetical protein
VFGEPDIHIAPAESDQVRAKIKGVDVGGRLAPIDQ